MMSPNTCHDNGFQQCTTEIFRIDLTQTFANFSHLKNWPRNFNRCRARCGRNRYHDFLPVFVLSTSRTLWSYQRSVMADIRIRLLMGLDRTEVTSPNDSPPSSVQLVCQNFSSASPIIQKLIGRHILPLWQFFQLSWLFTDSPLKFLNAIKVLAVRRFSSFMKCCNRLILCRSTLMEKKRLSRKSVLPPQFFCRNYSLKMRHVKETPKGADYACKRTHWYPRALIGTWVPNSR